MPLYIEPKHVPSQTLSFLPAYNPAATSPEDVYKLSDSKTYFLPIYLYVIIVVNYIVINDDIMSQLKAPAATLVRATPEDVTEWREKER